MDAFISHASEDSRLATRIEEMLDKNGLEAWLDHSDLRPGVLLREELQSEIKNSRTLVLLWSAPASRSRWVAAEVMMAFHLDRFIIPCVLDDTPVPEFLRNTVFLDIRSGETDVFNRLSKAVREAPAVANKMPPVIRSQSAELGEIIKSINNGQMKELELIGKGEFERAAEIHNLVDEGMQLAEKKWRLDPMIINLHGYHCKNAYMLNHWDAIRAGRPPKDPVLEEGESYFFQALYVNPKDLSAINGLGSILFYELELDAAEFFIRKAIDLAKQQKMTYTAAKHDLDMVLQYKKMNEPVSLPNEIITAIQKSDINTVKTFIEKTDNVNMVDSYGATMLHWVAYYGNLDLAKFLLSKGADPNLKDIQGNTPTASALKAKNYEMSILLATKIT